MKLTVEITESSANGRPATERANVILSVIETALREQAPAARVVSWSGTER